MASNIQMNIDIKIEIERLLNFGRQQQWMDELDTMQARNALLELFACEEPHYSSVEAEALATPVPILGRMLDYAADAGLLSPNTITMRDLWDARIMGLVMPRPSEVAHKFWHTARTASMKQATDAFYQLSIASNYIRMDRIAKNEYWLTPTEYGDLEITINLSKPEKDPRDIAAERNAPSSSYPKCVLCPENVGYPGRINHPARQNHRIIPFTINEETWYLQYSPYVYYDEHCIVLSEQHVPMAMNRATLVKLIDFIDRVPHYFVGSNADLPIVGGSILSHDHFQGGRHVFPMERASVEHWFNHPEEAAVRVGIVKWPMSVIRLQAADREALIEAGDTLIAFWREYSDEAVDLLAYSADADQQLIPHNTITPIARRWADGSYELDLVLRNNRTSAEHPDGIFHPHQDLHHIKKENIGLIEVMGLAVLPGRLKAELEWMESVLTGEMTLEAEIAALTDHPLHPHYTWLSHIVARTGTQLTSVQAREQLRMEVGEVFSRVLADAGIFKRTDRGKAAFLRFMNEAGYVSAHE